MIVQGAACYDVHIREVLRPIIDKLHVVADNIIFTDILVLQSVS